MAVTGNVVHQGNLSGTQLGTESFTDTIPFTAGVGQQSIFALSSGANTITVPTGTTYIRFLGPNAASPSPNPAFSGTLTLKGISGDTGFPVSAKYPSTFAFDSTQAAPATFIVNASTTATVTITFW